MIPLPPGESEGFRYAEWLAAGNTPEPAPEPPPPTPEQLVAIYDAALEAHFDAKAKERNYNNWRTAALRAGYNGPFQQEGLAFAQWMDACNVYAVNMLAAVQAGTRALPAVEQFIVELPVLTWPTNPLPNRPSKK